VGTFVGIMLGAALIAVGIASGQAQANVFWNWQGLAIVLGGTIAATLISYPLPEVFRGFRSFFVIFRSGVHDLVDAVNRLVTATRIFHREGVTATAQHAAGWKDLWIFKDGLQLMINGYTRDEAKEILEDQVRWQLSRERKQENLFNRMAKIAPAFGMVGTLIGLINMLITLQSHPQQVGEGLAIALTTTFYGLILANLVFSPIAAKIRERAENNVLLQTMQIETILMLYDKRNYVFVREKLAAYLNAGLRKKVQQTAGVHPATGTSKVKKAA